MVIAIIIIAIIAIAIFISSEKKAENTEEKKVQFRYISIIRRRRSNSFKKNLIRKKVNLKVLKMKSSQSQAVTMV